jgi:hypothetical protein
VNADAVAIDKNSQEWEETRVLSVSFCELSESTAKVRKSAFSWPHQCCPGGSAHDPIRKQGNCPNPSSPLSASHEAGWTDRHLASLPRGKAWAYLSINLRLASDIPEHNFNKGAMESNQEQLLVDGNVYHGVWRACCGRDWR